MGMSASQARLLSITARINDVEYKSQQISNTKLRLADEAEQLATNYTNALNKQKYTYTDYSSGSAVKVDLNSSTLANYGLTLVSRNPQFKFRVMNDSTHEILAQTFDNRELAELHAAGLRPRMALPRRNAPNYEVLMESFQQQMSQTYSVVQVDVSVPTNYSSSELYEMIQSGQFYIQQNAQEVNMDSSSSFAIENDNSELAKAEAEYNAATAKINRKEKLLDNDLKALDTEHSALTTEFESVKSLIGDNVEKSFNLFS